MKKKLGKYFKIGIGILVPFAIVFFVINWLYGTFSNIVISLLPSSMQYEWYYVIVFIVGLAVVIFLIGWIFSSFKIVKWIKKKFEKLVDKVPLVGSLYSFGLELVDSFIADTKGDGEVIIIESGEMCQTDGMMIGVLTNQKYNLITLPTVPNPTNGFLIKTTNYNILGTVIGDMVKILTSMGRLGADKWLLKNQDKIKEYKVKK